VSVVVKGSHGLVPESSGGGFWWLQILAFWCGCDNLEFLSDDLFTPAVILLLRIARWLVPGPPSRFGITIPSSHSLSAVVPVFF